jgi:hypothetical protein
MGEIAGHVGGSVCRILPPQSSGSGRTSSACMSSMEVAVGGRLLGRVQSATPRVKSNGTNSRSCDGGVGKGWGRLVGGSCWRGSSGDRRSTAARAQAQESESGVSWMNKGSPYLVLGVSPDCTEEDIKVAFRNRVRNFVDLFVFLFKLAHSEKWCIVVLEVVDLGVGVWKFMG